LGWSCHQNIPLLEHGLCQSLYIKLGCRKLWALGILGSLRMASTLLFEQSGAGATQTMSEPL
jgi:hypothetical protein